MAGALQKNIVTISIAIYNRLHRKYDDENAAHVCILFAVWRNAKS